MDGLSIAQLSKNRDPSDCALTNLVLETNPWNFREKEPNKLII